MRPAASMLKGPHGNVTKPVPAPRCRRAIEPAPRPWADVVLAAAGFARSLFFTANNALAACSVFPILGLAADAGSAVSGHGGARARNRDRGPDSAG